jgi:hypothetical protein
VRVIVRTGIGYLLFAGGLTFFVYGLAQSLRAGSCGGYRAACPSGFGPMIVLMVLGVFVALIGAAVASVTGAVVARLVFTGVVAVIAGVVLGFVDLHDGDSRPGLEVVVAVLGPLAVLSLPGPATRETRRGPPKVQPVAEAPITFAGPAPEWERPAATRQSADDIAARLRQLDQLRDSGLVDEAAYKERRAQILAEL